MAIPQELLDATITVLYLNEPKQAGWSWSVKDKDGAYWGCKDDIAKMLSRGATVAIQYSERQSNGKTYKDIKRIVPRQQPRPETNGAQPRSTYTSGANDRAIFVTGLSQRILGSGQFGIEDITKVVLAVDAAFDALEAKRSGKRLPPVQPRRMPEEPGDAYEPPMDEDAYIRP